MSRPGLKRIDVHRAGPVILAVPVGEVDKRSGYMFARLLRDVRQTDAQVLALSFEAVARIQPGGVDVLALLVERAADAGLTFRIVNLPREIGEQFPEGQRQAFPEATLRDLLSAHGVSEADLRISDRLSPDGRDWPRQGEAAHHDVPGEAVDLRDRYRAWLRAEGRAGKRPRPPVPPPEPRTNAIVSRLRRLLPQALRVAVVVLLYACLGLLVDLQLTRIRHRHQTRSTKQAQQTQMRQQALLAALVRIERAHTQDVAANAARLSQRLDRLRLKLRGRQDLTSAKAQHARDMRYLGSWIAALTSVAADRSRAEAVAMEGLGLPTAVTQAWRAREKRFRSICLRVADVLAERQQAAARPAPAYEKKKGVTTKARPGPLLLCHVPRRRATPTNNGTTGDDDDDDDERHYVVWLSLSLDHIAKIIREADHTHNAAAVPPVVTLRLNGRILIHRKAINNRTRIHISPHNGTNTLSITIHTASPTAARELVISISHRMRVIFTGKIDPTRAPQTQTWEFRF